MEDSQLLLSQDTQKHHQDSEITQQDFIFNCIRGKNDNDYKSIKSSMKKSILNSKIESDRYIAKHQFGVLEDSIVDPLNEEQKRNGGWLWSGICMILSFILTFVCMQKLMQARARHNVSFSELGFRAMGKPGRFAVDLFLTLQQFGFVCGQLYFILSTTETVIKDATPNHYDFSRIYIGIIAFFVMTPLSYVRQVQKFAIFYIFADVLILVTVVTIIAYSSQSVVDHGWGEGDELLNKGAFLSMIGSSITAFEGIGIVIPLLDITEKPELYPRILFAVLCTVLFLYTFFAEFNYFAYGDKIVDPLITALLPTGIIVYLVKNFFTLNMVITFPLQVYPANIIIESYIFKNMKPSKKEYILKNLSRTVLSALAVIVTISLGDGTDKFLSLVGSLACCPVSFAIPALLHYHLCNPTKNEKIVDILLCVIAGLILVFCTGFTIWTWNE
ncbi:UNKNOWN [Stylonychia lemnae]|uniref:Amino acid transporter transmembrane domain-containing protein n=1 Tax=Stylonychia lemnae TaxID=5949 RepID=A0A078B4W1_STYLE|nr:UNKNOWN [Stylonychia lemnae]|eukprot:CDW89459.1 UNKNOWN [Stylonychia lemnae]